jgi:RNA-binding protein 39
VQQLAARLETRHLIAFFDKVGKVKEAQIVRDRVTGRSKGYVSTLPLAITTSTDYFRVGYVEFIDKDSVPAALQLTGQSLKGVPIIVQLTEAEKNRQARTSENSNGNAAAPFHRLYVGNIHFSLTEDDIRQIFETFGPLEAANLTRDENGRSRGYGFVQYENAESAKEALEKMQGFELAGRAIRVGLGNDRSHEAAMQRVGPQNQASSFSGAGGRGVHAGGTNNFDRTGPRQNEKISGASALDDTEIAGVNFNNISRHSLMDKLARRTETKDKNGVADKAKPTTSQPAPAQAQPSTSQTQISRCIVVHNAFDLRAYVLPHLTNYCDHKLTTRSREETTDPTGAWIQKLQEEFKEEFDKTYGRTVHIGVDPNSHQGNVYVKFIDAESGKKAKLGLNGRHFARRMVSANYLVEPVYDAMYPEARNI